MGFLDRRRCALASTLFIAAVAGTAPASAEFPGAPPGPARVAASKIASSELGSCAVTPTSTLHCWGEGDSGQLLTGSEDNVGDTPGKPTTQIPLGAGVVPTQVSSGYAHTCAVVKDGGVLCWGRNIYGQVGDGNAGNARGDGPGETAFRVKQPGGQKVTQVATGREHTCAVLADGSVSCWGANTGGQLAIGSTDSSAHLPALLNLGGAKASAVSTRDSTTCVLLTTGKVRCFGGNSRGQVGVPSDGNAVVIGDQPGEVPVQPTVLPADETFSAISAGQNFVCALSTAGTVYCWGEGARGQLSNGRTYGTGTTQVPAAVTIALGAPATAISTGDETVCALAAGAVRCWGDNDSGHLGAGFVGNNWGDDLVPVDETVPPTIDLGAGRTATALAVGGDHTCALLSSGQPLCWGEGGSGQLASGNSSDTGVKTPAMLQPVTFAADTVVKPGKLKIAATLKAKSATKSCPSSVTASVSKSDPAFSAKLAAKKKTVGGKLRCTVSKTVTWAGAPPAGTAVKVVLTGKGLAALTVGVEVS